MPIRISNDSKAYFLLSFFLCGVLVCLWSIIGFDQFVLDDAYIVEHSVSSIVAGKEMRFIGAQPWEGVTSPLYTGIIVIFAQFFPLSLAHWGVSTLAIILLVCGFYKLCRLQEMTPLLSFLLAVTSLFVGKTFYQITNGLETAMGMSALTWIIVALSEKKIGLWAFALAALQPFIRPELSALSIIFIGFTLLHRSPNVRKGLAVFCVTFVLGCGVLYWQAGFVLPNTISAKASFIASHCQPLKDRLSDSFIFLLSFFIALGPCSLGFVFAIFTRLRWIMISFFAIFFLAYLIKLPEGLVYNHSRYAFLLMPFALYGWAATLNSTQKTVAILSRSSALVVVMFLVFSLPGQAAFYRRQIDYYANENTQMAAWVAKNIPQDSVVLVLDAGRISQIGVQPLVDLVGLKSIESAYVHQELTDKSCNRALAIDTIAQNTHAQYFVTTTDWERVFSFLEMFKHQNWSIERVDNERGETLYRVYRISKRGSNDS